MALTGHHGHASQRPNRRRSASSQLGLFLIQGGAVGSHPSLPGSEDPRHRKLSPPFYVPIPHLPPPPPTFLSTCFPLSEHLTTTDASSSSSDITWSLPRCKQPCITKRRIPATVTLLLLPRPADPTLLPYDTQPSLSSVFFFPYI